MRLVTEGDAGELDDGTYRSYVARFAKVSADLRETIASYGLPIDDDPARATRLEGLREELAAKGARFRNDGKSIVYGALSPACERCRTGHRSISQFISLACPNSCWFCFNENQHDYGRYLRSHTSWKDDLHAYHDSMGGLDFVALTGGEPMLYPDEANAFLQESELLDPDAHRRLYTSGYALDRRALERLAESGLDEIRYSIKVDIPGYSGERRDASGDVHGGFAPLEEQLEMVELAVGTIPSVMVEMPVVPGTADQMRTVLSELDRMGATGINLLELCFPLHHADEFAARGLTLVADPYRIPYSYQYAGALPVAGSEELALELMCEAIDGGLGLGMHYCSLENKNTAQIFEQNHGGKVGIPPYRFSERDFFYHVVRAFEGDALQTMDLLDREGIPYETDVAETMAAFDPRWLPLLAAEGWSGDGAEGPKLFLSSAVMEPTGDGRERFREIGLQVLEPGDLAGNV